MATGDKDPALYCGNFPPELKKRCEGIAGYLGKSITVFVAEILDDETKDLKGSCEAITKWYKARLQAKSLKPDVLNSPHESRKEEVRRDSGQTDPIPAGKTLRGKARTKA